MAAGKQGLLFDEAEGLRQRDAGMQLAADHTESLLDLAREIARELARGGAWINADDVQRVLYHRTGQLLGNACGSLFRGDEWEFTGTWRTSARVSNHGRMNRVWKLKRF